MRRSLFATVAFLVACGGAGDSSGPAAPGAPGVTVNDVTVAASVTSTSAPTLRYTPPVQVEVTCDVTVKAEATGSGKGSWLDATINFYDLRDTTRLTSVVSVGAAELKSAWSHDSIAAGQGEQSRWTLTAASGFAAAFRARYQSGTNTRTAAVWLRCAPPSATKGVAAPSITSLSVTPSSGTIGAGTPIDVSFTESTPAGALITMVRTTGPCVAEWGWSENFATSLNRTVPLTLAYPCELGVPIGIDVVTYDAMGSSVAGGKSTTVTMTDTVPPTTSTLFWHRGGQDLITSPYGQWAAGDTLWAEVHVQDNYKVEGLFLEVYPFGTTDTTGVVRDSLVDDAGDFVQPRSAIQRFPVVLRPGWAGSQLQFRYYGRDSEGRVSNVFTTEAGCVTITAPSPSLSASEIRTGTASRLVAAGSCVYTAGDPAPSQTPLASTPGVKLSSSSAGIVVVPSAYRATAIR